MGTGSYLPSAVVTNQDIMAMVDLSHFDPGRSGPYDQWVSQTMGFVERRWAAQDQATSDLAHAAAAEALVEAGLGVDDIDMIIACTSTPDMRVPNTAALVQGKLGAANSCPAFEISAACAGFVFALHMADAMMKQHAFYRHVLIVGAEMGSSVIDRRNYITCPIFGDGAGAVVLGRSANDGRGILGGHVRSDGRLADYVVVPAGGSALPITPENIEEVYARGQHGIRLETARLKDAAIERLVEAARTVLKDHGLSVQDIAHWVPHQAGKKILEGTMTALGISPSAVLLNYQRYANTSQASIPILLHENRHLFKPGDMIMMLALGGGLCWGALLYQWPA
ncbi:MAG: beta-ketoacyl-ACP synthase 3 [Pseudomonadota bacterium]